MRSQRGRLRLRVWLITLGEPLPIDGPQTRLLRTGFLSRALRSRGHEVTWFSNRFSHFTKTHRAGPDVRQTAPGERLVLLNSRGYQSNVSLDRFLDHRDLVKDFEVRARSEALPDVVVTSLPTIDLSLAAVEAAHRFGAPVVVDIRDLWPDSIWDLVPRALRPLMQVATFPFELELRSALKGATAVTSHVPAFVEWARRKTPAADRSLDRVFPLGYEPLAADADTSHACEFWRQQGVTLDGGEFLAVYVGTISRQCEFGHVIEAARAMAGEVKFVFCGSGDLLPELQKAAAVTSNMIVPGWCSHAQISVLLEQAGAGLMPYRRLPNFVGAIPNKALEYMAHGLPIIWRLETGELAELLHRERAGLTYDGTSEGLVAALGKIRELQENRAEVKKRLITLFTENFTAGAVYETMAEYVEFIVRAGNTHGELAHARAPY